VDWINRAQIRFKLSAVVNTVTNLWDQSTWPDEQPSYSNEELYTVELVTEMFSVGIEFWKGRDEVRAVQMESTDVCRIKLFHDTNEIYRVLNSLFYPEYGWYVTPMKYLLLYVDISDDHLWLSRNWIYKQPLKYTN
jgi:hypothetical protein